ncbi:MAG TPA: NAD(P)-binding domain-containing protein [Jatrophihabitantaceae bacterium]|nr:NAD(P)-binding domain-containing protein [Jatrophihabitantaceae bacterium]
MSSPVLDCLVVGAGPAGLQLSQHLAEAGRDYLVLEAGSSPGTFFRTFPRHRRLISINKVHTGTDDPELNLRMDWNSLLSPDPRLLLRHYSSRYFPDAGDLARYLADYADALALNVRYNTRVARIGRVEQGFEVATAAGETFEAQVVVVATGVGNPYVAPIPGIELAEQYATVSVDAADFVDQRVLIIGKGNSALETADNLVETAAVIHIAGPGSIRMAWKSHYVGHLRAVNNNFLDTYQLKSQNAILDGTVRSIERHPEGGFLVRFAFSRANEFVKELRYDRVIGCTGFRFDASIFAPDCRPELIHDDRLPVLTSAYESAAAPGVYFAGTLMQQRDFKRSTGGFIHGFRYAIRALSRILEQRQHGVPWPSTELGTSPEELAGAVLARVNRTSALWQQFGVLGDVVAVADGSARYLEEVPVDYVHDGGLGRDVHDVFVVTLEYGPDHDKVDPFDITVARVAQDDTERSFDAAYLHPVVRHHRDGELVAVHHLAENLENEWAKPAVHRDPLIAFFGRELSLARTQA